MDLFYVSLNLIMIVIMGLGVLVARTRSRRRAEAHLPTSMRPDCSGDELADAVAEWARTTGTLTAERPHRIRTDPAGWPRSH